MPGMSIDLVEVVPVLPAQKVHAVHVVVQVLVVVWLVYGSSAADRSAVKEVDGGKVVHHLASWRLHENRIQTMHAVHVDVLVLVAVQHASDLAGTPVTIEMHFHMSVQHHQTLHLLF